MRKPRNIPDPSATEPPQQFASEASTRLKERVFEVAERESHMEPIEHSAPLEPPEPDRILAQEIEPEEPASSMVSLLLMGGAAFFVSMALVTVVGMLLMVFGLLALTLVQ